MPRTETKAITDTLIRALKPGPAPRIICDTLSPLRIKLSKTGAASYFVSGRFGGAANPATRTIGKVGTLKLPEARERARTWALLAKAGDDPLRLEREAAAAAKAEAALTFDAVLAEYARLHLSTKRRGKTVEKEIRRNRPKAWKDMPLTALTRADVLAAVDPIVARGCPYEAHNFLSALKTMLAWAAERHDLDRLPTDRLKLARVCGPTPPRQRVLSDDELFAFWRAAGRLPFPHGPALKLILLTAGRHSEVLGARWREIDLKQRLLIIPPERFKSNATHRIPLSPAAIELLKELPRWARGDCLFSTTDGRLPARQSGPAKARLDVLMLRTLKALARARGEDPAQVKLEPWVIHDLRRVVRSHLSALRVPEHICEAVLGHGAKGLARVYNLHRHEPEMREALELWADKLSSIVAQPTDHNVVKFKQSG
jgi:integrase